jgi:hypothetical protein
MRKLVIGLLACSGATILMLFYFLLFVLGHEVEHDLVFASFVLQVVVFIRTLKYAIANKFFKRRTVTEGIENVEEKTPSSDVP